MDWVTMLPQVADPRNYLLLIAIASVFWGAWVPRKVVEDVKATAESRLIEADKRSDLYKIAYETSEAARAQQAEQLAVLLEYARTTDSFIRSLNKPATGKVDQ